MEHAPVDVINFPTMRVGITFRRLHGNVAVNIRGIFADIVRRRDDSISLAALETACTDHNLERFVTSSKKAIVAVEYCVQICLVVFVLYLYSCVLAQD